MGKKILILCFALILTGCMPIATNVDFPQQTSPASTEDKPVMGTIGETTPPTTTITEETVTEKPEIPKLTDDEINALNNKEISYGQGRQVDENNCPTGALSFQEEFIKYDAYAVLDDENEIHLTFDQGYEMGYTSKILDVLKEKGAKATFFLTGHYIETEPELIQRMIDEGHTLGNHGNKHLSLPLLTIEEAEKELQVCHDMVMDKFGYEMVLERPPAGTYSEKSLALTQRLGYKSMLWSFAYKDWEVDNQPDPEEAYTRITEAAHNGGIFLLHSVSKTNSEILERVIDNFTAQGYSLTGIEFDSE